MALLTTEVELLHGDGVRGGKKASDVRGSGTVEEIQRLARALARQAAAEDDAAERGSRCASPPTAPISEIGEASQTNGESCTAGMLDPEIGTSLKIAPMRPSPNFLSPLDPMCCSSLLTPMPGASILSWHGAWLEGHSCDLREGRARSCDD